MYKAKEFTNIIIFDKLYLGEIGMKETKYNLKSVWKYFKPYKKNLIIFIILTFIIGVLGTISPLFTAKIIEDITSNKLKIVLYVSILLFITNIITSLLTYLNNKIFYNFQGRAVKEIKYNYCKSILNTKTILFDKMGSGLFLSRFTTDLVTYSYIFSQIINNLNSIIINIGVYIIVFSINIYIGFYFIIGSFILYYINKIKNKQRNKIWREYKHIDEKNQSILSEMLRGFRDLKVLDLKKGMLKYIDNNLEENRFKSYNMDMINSKYDMISNNIQSLLRIMLLILCLILINNKSLSIANFLIVFVYQDKIYGLIYSLTHIITELNLFNLCSKNILEIMSNIKKDEYGDKDFKSCKGNLEFKNVSFSYKKNKNILNNINFKINAKEKVSIVGKSGVGKSTLINLICKLYDIKSGEILIDNHNINDLSYEYLKRNISVVSQNPYIFNLSIKENLMLAKEKVSMEEIINSCKLVSLHDYIMTLPNKYDTILDENGINLSGGQKQRLSIARAIIKNSKIIIFDEATNSLDEETNKIIKETINFLNKNSTIIIITHKLKNITDSDKIILIENGEIVKIGNHKDLMTNKLYQKLYNEN